MQPKPIDVLIVESALRKPIVTAGMLAMDWGEDKTRISDWLLKLHKLGVLRWVAAIAYDADPAKAREYLSKRSQPIP